MPGTLPEILSRMTPLLTLVWFFVYWIAGGVFFAVVTISRLGRLRKARFSCLFTVFAAVVAYGAAFQGLRAARLPISRCLAEASSRADVASAIFGCGFVGVFGWFLLGLLALIVGGFLLMSLSKTQSRPWIVLEEGGEDVPKPRGQDSVWK